MSMEEWSFEVQQKFEIPYKYSPGAFMSRFFVELRDRGRLLGARCPSCGRVYMPPRSICGRCHRRIEEWAEVGEEGTLLSFTVVHYKEPFHPREAPFALGLIKLDGADTGLLHLLGEVDPKKLKVGMRVRAVLREKRAGNILDIQHFRPVE